MLESFPSRQKVDSHDKATCQITATGCPPTLSPYTNLNRIHASLLSASWSENVNTTHHVFCDEVVTVTVRLLDVVNSQC